MNDFTAVIEILQGLFDSAPQVRMRSADEVTDILGSLDDWNLELVSRGLVTAWLVEDAEPAQEAMLHALSELSTSRGLPPAVVDRLTSVRLSSVPEPHREYLTGIREDSALQ